MSRWISLASVLIVGWLSCSPAIAQCTYPNTFMIGTTADALAVNANFSSLSNTCAPLASPVFTGSVGIGMAGSHGRLDIAAGTGMGINVRSADTTKAALLLTNLSYGSQDADGVAFYQTAGGNAQLYASNTYVWQAGIDGSFLVGTATNGGWTGDSKVAFVASAANSGALSLQQTGAAQTLLLRLDNLGGSLIDFRYSTTGIGSITTNGSLIIISGTSDARLKSNVADLSANRALRALKAYHPQEYLLRGRPGVGALAQEVDRRMSAIGIDATALGIVTRGDANLRLREGQPGFRQWGMDSSKMVPFIIRTTLDHEERLEVLEAENAVLKRQVRDLARTVALLGQGMRSERQAAGLTRMRVAR